MWFLFEERKQNLWEVEDLFKVSQPVNSRARSRTKNSLKISLHILFIDSITFYSLCDTKTKFPILSTELVQQFLMVSFVTNSYVITSKYWQGTYCVQGGV